MTSGNEIVREQTTQKHPSGYCYGAVGCRVSFVVARRESRGGRYRAGGGGNSLICVSCIDEDVEEEHTDTEKKS